MARYPKAKEPWPTPRPVQSVIRILTNECGVDPFVVFLEHKEEFAGEAVMVLVGFGMDDVVRGMVRPARTGHRSRRKPRRGKPKWWKPKYGWLPEIGEIIGSKIRKATGSGVFDAVAGDKTKKLWIVDGVLQRILFYWMIYDLIDSITYKWMLAVLLGEKCRNKFGKWGIIWNDSVNAHALINPHAFPIDTSILKCQGITCSHTGFQVPAGFEYWVLGCIKITNTYNQPVTFRLNIYDGFSPDIITLKGESVTVQPGEEAQCFVKGFVKGAQDVIPGIVTLPAGYGEGDLAFCWVQAVATA